MAAVTLIAIAGCGESELQGENPAWQDWYATEVVAFEPGDGAGFNAGELPDIVTGPPDPTGGASTGSMEVVSLGDGGEIIVGFGDREIVDGDGADFIVFENPFWPAGEPDEVWAELGEVSVSPDGERWHTFECDYGPDDGPPYEGCAGWTPTFEFDVHEQLPPDPNVTGGDRFDLGDLGVERARYVRIRDVWGRGQAPSRGFDLDAVGVIHRQ